MHDSIIYRETGDANRTGLRFGTAWGKISAQLLSRLMGNPGYRVKWTRGAGEPAGTPSGPLSGPSSGAPDATIHATEWRFETSSDQTGASILSGPYFEGRSLDDLVLSGDGERLFADVARALSDLGERGLLPDEPLSCGILAAPGDVLILPPKAVQQAVARLSPERRRDCVAYLRSPKARNPESAAVFMFAQAAYRLACGRPAYTEDSVSDLGAAGIPFVHGGFLSASLVRPGLRAELAGLIDAGLSDPSGLRMSAWIPVLESCARDGWIGESDPSKIAEAEKAREAGELRIRNENRRSVFWRRKGGIIAVVAATVVVAAFVVGSVILDKRNGPDFSNLTPPALVETYYKAVDALDSIAMEAAANRTAYKTDDTLVSNLTVLTKMRMAYERKSPLVSAREWLAAGKPAGETGTLVYGITDLVIAALPPEAGADSSPRFSAEYTLWTTRSAEIDERMSADAAKDERKDSPPDATKDATKAVAPPDSPAPPIVEGRRIRDTLLLEPAKKIRNGIRGWKIATIERTELGTTR